MIYYIMHFLTGYCHVQISGPMKERFLNLTAGKQILIWRLYREKDIYTFYISRRGSKMLPEVAMKTGTDFLILKRSGLPFLFDRYRGRKCFVLSFLICVCILSVLSRYIWRIDVSGSLSHSQEELMDYLEDKGIKCGIKISVLNCQELEEDIREDFRDISWVSCERKGTLLSIAVKETLDTSASDQTPSSPCNLIASKEGTVESIVVRKGTARVKKGSKVKQGDVLISGIVPLINDAGEVTEEAKVAADGDVLVITKQSYDNSMSLLKTEKTYSGKEHKSFGLLIFGHYMDIPSRHEYLSDFDTQTEKHDLHFGSQFYLPFSLIVRTDKEYSVAEKKLTREEALSDMKKQLSYFLAKYEAKGVEILKNNVKIDCDELTCTARGTIIMRERFGKIQKI